jgi:hypothetical protein
MAAEPIEQPLAVCVAEEHVRAPAAVS